MVRPIYLNIWESAHFDFNEDTLVDLAEKTANLGIELFVLDDGCFKNRNDEPQNAAQKQLMLFLQPHFSVPYLS